MNRLCVNSRNSLNNLFIDPDFGYFYSSVTGMTHWVGMCRLNPNIVNDM